MPFGSVVDTVRLAGRFVIVGGVMSTTFTVTVAVASGDVPFVAVAVTWKLPSPRLVPGAGL